MFSTTQIIESFAAGRLSQKEAMSMLHMENYSELLNALADRGIPPPKPPAEQVEEELKAAMPILDMLEAAKDDPRNRNS